MISRHETHAQFTGDVMISNSTRRAAAPTHEARTQLSITPTTTGVFTVINQVAVAEPPATIATTTASINVIAIGTATPAPNLHDAATVIRTYGHVVEQVLRRFPPAILRGAVVDVDDLRQEGLLGLLAAASRFTTARGAQFTTYAYTCVSNAICGQLRKIDWLPEDVRREMRILQDGEEKLRRDGARSTMSELRLITGLSADRIRLLRIWNEGGQTTSDSALVDWPAPHTLHPEQWTIQNDTAQRLRKGIRALPPQTQRILLARLVDQETVRSIAAAESLSPARISQICTAASVKLISEYLD